ncbi:MAG: hypothetical protein KY437_08950 [Actinobacteria bacterium]|nr:hypothetical protein [Actinomycetota bacterium]
MTQYMLSVWYPADADQPAPDDLEWIIGDVESVHRQLQDEGSWVFGGGLHDPSTATVVTARGGRAVTMDGPFVETKEVLGGFSVIEVEDLDAALRWAERMSEATTCPIEVRPFQ